MVLKWANDMKASVYHTIQPIKQRTKWPQLHSCGLVDVIKTTRWSSNQALGKKYERGLVVGTSQAGLSSSETADLWDINHLYVQKKKTTSSEQQLCEQYCPVDVRGQRRMNGLVPDDGGVGIFSWCHWSHDTSLSAQKRSNSWIHDSLLTGHFSFFFFTGWALKNPNILHEN